ncbi:hypothetical protein OROGR_013895 [Orobanche gracilis]
MILLLLRRPGLTMVSHYCINKKMMQKRWGYFTHPFISWLNKGVLHPIQNRKTAGLCRNGRPDSWATFTMVVIFEGELKIGGAKELNKYSEQNMEDLLYHQPQNSKGSQFGGQIFFVFQYLMKKGLGVASDYPNNGSHEQLYEDKSCA